jgi:hypothetical protein
MNFSLRNLYLLKAVAFIAASSYITYQPPSFAQSYQQIRQLGRMMGPSFLKGAASAAGGLVTVQAWRVIVDGQPRTVRTCTPYNYSGQPYVC